MRTFVEVPFYLINGVDTYNPPLSGAELKFSRLKNFQPRRNRLSTVNGFEPQSTLNATGGILAIGSYTEPIEQISSLYAFSKTSVYVYNFLSNTFTAAPIYTDFNNDDERYVLIPWYDKLYATKLNSDTISLSAGAATVYSSIPAGRYGVCSNSHLMFANISTPGGKFPSRVQWSDLYNPTNFVIDTDSEADYFDLEESDGECTGLSYQRGNTLVYSRSNIWIASYSNGKYNFDVLYSGIGNVYHHAQVRVKEIDFFIGEDGIYTVDGLQLKSVGDPIWAFFSGDVANDWTLPVVGTVDAAHYEVFWTYTNKSGTKWQIVYNFKEDKWSDRDPQGEVCRYRFTKPVRGFQTIDSFSTMIDGGADSVKIIDGSWQFTTFFGKEFIGCEDGNVYQTSTTKFQKADETSLVSEFETFDMFFDKAEHVKEFNKLVLQFARTGSPTLRIATCVRQYLSDPVVWSDWLNVASDIDSATSFYSTTLFVGKFIRFKLQVTNTDENHLKELYLLSLFVQNVEQTDEVEEE